MTGQFCPECGTRHENDWKFCRNCGHDLAKTARSTIPSEPREIPSAPVGYHLRDGRFVCDDHWREDCTICSAPVLARVGGASAVSQIAAAPLGPAPQPVFALSSGSPQPAPPPQYNGLPHAQKQSTSGLAIASLVLGVIPAAGIGGILALVFGYKARKQIDESNGGLNGRGMATAGIVLGWVWTVCLGAILIIGIVAAIGGQPRERVGAAATSPFSADTTPATDPSVTTPWHPADYEEVPGSPGFAYRFVANVNNIVCDPGTTCWNVRVISRNGCSSGITIDLTTEDSNGTAIGTATDTFTGAVRPGQAALLKPVDTDPTAATVNAEVSSISGDTESDFGPVGGC
jgi:hypothetical protein